MSALATASEIDRFLDKARDGYGLEPETASQLMERADLDLLLEAARDLRQRVLAVSPIVGGKSLKGPSDRMLAELGYEVSAASVARLYRDIASAYVLDREDAGEQRVIEALGFRAFVTDTVMRKGTDKIRLARELAPWLGIKPQSSRTGTATRL